MSDFCFLRRGLVRTGIGLLALLSALPAQAADPYDGEWVVFKSGNSTRPPFLFQRLKITVAGDRFSGTYVNRYGERTMHGVVQTGLARDLQHTRKWLTWTEAAGGAVSVTICELEGSAMRIHVSTNPVSYCPEMFAKRATK